MSEEDDWFERALRDADADSDAVDDGENGGSGGDQAGADDEAGGENADGEASEPEGGGEPDDERGSDPFGGIREGERDPSRDVVGSLDEGDLSDGDLGDDGPGGGESGDGDPFGDGEFGDDSSTDDPSQSADENGDEAESDPFGGGSFGEDDPFGGGSAGSDTADPTDSGGGFGGGSFGEDDPFGGGGGGEGGGPTGGGQTGSGPTGESTDPFGGYRGNAAGDSGGSNDVGFGEFDGAESGEASPGFDVDPDEFESSIERTDIGIEGLDEMILGGVPRRSLLSVIGGAGTGKTTFALQFLNEALESDRKGIYITLEQTRESILATAEEKGWSFREHADEDRLAVVAIDPIEMANSLASIRNDLVRLIAEFDADRLVLDSVSLLEMMYDHPAKRRSEVFGFTRSLKEAGVTTLLTSEASERNPYASRHGIVEYLTDAVFVLQYIRGTDFRETRLAVEIQKIRDANHSRQSKPYEITDTGISVYGQANIF
ncbi:KaiC domain-containing protein [Halorubrum halophilum]|uniref:KaiC domain-containing protein n=1 Tax=Halorubrum halophilum TaxID=413816 RepID=UPI0006798066|nr:KaiC domain-containing protein [Halorubrum halophilum]